MFDEPSFEWMFVVPELSEADDPRIDVLLERCDAVVESHSDLTLISTVTRGQSAVDAALVAIRMLDESSLSAERTYIDLVTRADIAVRVEKTRQAVDNWVRGDRQKGFPRPVNLVAGGVWLWCDVAAWVRRERIKDLPNDGGVLYPTLTDHAVVDNRLASRAHFSAQSGLPLFGRLELEISSVEVLTIPSLIEPLTIGARSLVNIAGDVIDSIDEGWESLEDLQADAPYSEIELRA